MTLDYFLKYLIEKMTLPPDNITIHWVVTTKNREIVAIFFYRKLLSWGQN